MRRPLLIAAGAALAALLPWILGTDAWPEIVVSAYLTLHGRILYDTIIFPHTPLLILTTALFGKLFGFSSLLFRSIIAASMAAGGALIVASQPKREALGLAVGVPAYILWIAYAMGVSLWPDPLMAPLVLLAALALQHGELRTAALLLGLCIVTKQTSAWLLAAAVLWLIVVRRERYLSFLAWASLPYALFAVVWGVVFRTTSHIYWTLLMPLQGHGSEILMFSGQSLRKALLMFLVVPLFLIATKRWRSPLPWLAVGAWGMAWPRFDPIHLSAAAGILALMAVECIAAVPRQKLAGAALAVGVAAMAVDLPWWRLGGDVLFWDDPVSRFFAAELQRHVRPGGAFLNFNTPHENLYVLTNTTSPLSIYVNPSFWYYLNKRGVGATMCRELAAAHGASILFTPLAADEDPNIARTCLYDLVTHAPVVERVGIRWNPPPVWKRID